MKLWITWSNTLDHFRWLFRLGVSRVESGELFKLVGKVAGRVTVGGGSRSAVAGSSGSASGNNGSNNNNNSANGAGNGAPDAAAQGPAEEGGPAAAPILDWEEADRFSFEDSDRFEEDSLCSWSSEPESLCNNWRGWRRPPTAFGNIKRSSDGKSMLFYYYLYSLRENLESWVINNQVSCKKKKNSFFETFNILLALDWTMFLFEQLNAMLS